jgi:hypothetical protein
MSTTSREVVEPATRKATKSKSKIKVWVLKVKGENLQLKIPRARKEQR